METLIPYSIRTAAQAPPHEPCDRKQCRDCEKWFPLTEFYFTERAIGRRASYCKACNKARVRVIRRDIRRLAAAAGPKPNLNRVAAAWIRTS